jgi:hypothetical protein
MHVSRQFEQFGRLDSNRRKSHTNIHLSDFGEAPTYLEIRWNIAPVGKRQHALDSQENAIDAGDYHFVNISALAADNQGQLSRVDFVSI